MIDNTALYQEFSKKIVPFFAKLCIIAFYRPSVYGRRGKRFRRISPAKSFRSAKKFGYRAMIVKRSFGDPTRRIKLPGGT